MSRVRPDQIGDAAGDVQVGMEIARFGQQRRPVRQLRRGDQQLEQVHRGRIGDDHLVRLGADQGRHLGAEPLRRADPVVGVPAPDQRIAPLLGDHLPHPLARRLGHRPERIAVEVDQAVGQVEALAQRPQRIGSVGGDRFGVGSAPSADALS